MGKHWEWAKCVDCGARRQVRHKECANSPEAAEALAERSDDE